MIVFIPYGVTLGISFQIWQESKKKDLGEWCFCFLPGLLWVISFLTFIITGAFLTG
jgi:hypothetical protein